MVVFRMNLDEKSVDDAPLHACHLHLEQVHSHFARMRSMQVKHNVSEFSYSV
jgi:hypothetical protein